MERTLGNDIRQLEMTEWKYRQKTAEPIRGHWILWFGAGCAIGPVLAYLLGNLVDAIRSVYQAIK